MGKPLVLSTKILPHGLRERVIQNGLAYMEYNAIEVQNELFEMPASTEYIIFSSQNAIKAVLKKTKKLSKTKVLCVGEKSKKLLLENDINPLKMTENMSKLIDFIQKLPENAHFLHFCGNRRLPILAEKMNEWGRAFQEIIVYKTMLTHKKIDAVPDAVLFFSPSGVESHEKYHELANTHCFCIGDTTAAAFTQVPKSISVAKTPSANQVVAKAIHYFKLNQYA